MPGDQTWMKEKYSNLVEQGLDWKLRALETASEPRCIVDGRSNIMLCANNYLNLTTHDKVVNAMVEATKKYGAGSGSVRAIAGNMQLHEDLETTIAEFKGVEAALTYSAGYTANVGLIPTLVENKQDLIISDELNHGSIIDGVRLTKASRAVYPHNDTDALEEILRQNKNSRRKLIITDGVFSMDGDIAPLQEVSNLAEEYGAMTLVDDCHGEGVLGGGRGIVSHFSLQGKITFEIGSFSKALGVQGGILAGSNQVRTHALNNSRSWLLSGSQPPGVAAAQKAAIEVLMSEPEHVSKLWKNTSYFRTELNSLGFDTGVSETPIIPVMCGESKIAQEFSNLLKNEGIMVGAIVFPMVSRDKARVRTQMSSGLSMDDLDIVLELSLIHI